MSDSQLIQETIEVVQTQLQEIDQLLEDSEQQKQVIATYIEELDQLTAAYYRQEKEFEEQLLAKSGTFQVNT